MAQEVSKQPEAQVSEEVQPEQTQNELKQAIAEASQPDPKPQQPVAQEPQSQVVDEPVSQPTQQPPASPREIEEVDQILDELDNVATSLDGVFEQTEDLKNQGKIQQAINDYAHSLAHIPKALQYLHDIRRLIKPVQEHTEQVRSQLVGIRGDDNAMSSEEQRILVATSSIDETVLATINALEFVLEHTRNTSHELLTLVQYQRPNFAAFAKHTLGKHLMLHKVSETVHDEIGRLSTLRADLKELHELDAHAQSLSNV